MSGALPDRTSRAGLGPRYGDTEVIARRVGRLREQAADLRALADRLVARTEAVPWSGRAAEDMRQRVRDRAARVREAGARHDRAADALERHRRECDRLLEAIVAAERRATTLVDEARARLARTEQADPAVLSGPSGRSGPRRLPDPADQILAAFDPPPSGHRDWLDVDLPGL